MEYVNRLIKGDSLSVLEQLDDETFNLCLTSPPYYKKRRYGERENELGQESTPEEYLANLAEYFAQVWRTLKNDGSCYVNISDTYHKKGLLLIPFEFVRIMVANGWILRNHIIWHRPNQMPEPATDKFTTDHEHLFFFVKQRKGYYFKQVLDPYTTPLNRKGGNDMIKHDTTDSRWDEGTNHKTYRNRKIRPNPDGRNTRTVWSINTQQNRYSNQASFPDELARIPIKASCPEGGIVLDPFGGSGVVARECLRQEKNYTIIEIEDSIHANADELVTDAQIKYKKFF